MSALTEQELINRRIEELQQNATNTTTELKQKIALYISEIATITEEKNKVDDLANNEIEQIILQLNAEAKTTYFNQYRCVSTMVYMV